MENRSCVVTSHLNNDLTTHKTHIWELKTKARPESESHCPSWFICHLPVIFLSLASSPLAAFKPCEPTVSLLLVSTFPDSSSLLIVFFLTCLLTTFHRCGFQFSKSGLQGPFKSQWSSDSKGWHLPDWLCSTEKPQKEEEESTSFREVLCLTFTHTLSLDTDCRCIHFILFYLHSYSVLQTRPNSALVGLTPVNKCIWCSEAKRTDNAYKNKGTSCTVLYLSSL